MGIQLSDSVENIVGKEETVRNEQFLLFSYVSKAVLLMRQNEYLWSKEFKKKKRAHRTKHIHINLPFLHLTIKTNLNLHKIKNETLSNLKV